VKNRKDKRDFIADAVTVCVVMTFCILGLVMLFATPSRSFEMNIEGADMGNLLGAEHYCPYSVDRGKVINFIRFFIPVEQQDDFFQEMFETEALWIESGEVLAKFVFARMESNSGVDACEQLEEALSVAGLLE